MKFYVKVIDIHMELTTLNIDNGNNIREHSILSKVKR